MLLELYVENSIFKMLLENLDTRSQCLVITDALKKSYNDLFSYIKKAAAETMVINQQRLRNEDGISKASKEFLLEKLAQASVKMMVSQAIITRLTRQEWCNDCVEYSSPSTLSLADPDNAPFYSRTHDAHTVNVSYTKADYPLQPSSFLNAFQLSEEEYNIFTDHFYSFFAKITCRKDIAALRSQYRDEIKTKIEWANIDHVPDKHLSS